MPVAITQDEILSALKQCYDPEIPVNIVDLGLIYDIRFENATEENQDVAIDLTLTSQGCPEHVNISAQVKARVEQLPGVANVTVNVVWTPPWGPERLSPEWWRPVGAQGPHRTRDYYAVEDEAGRRFWLFRDGLYDREDLDKLPNWWLHGVFA